MNIKSTIQISLALLPALFVFIFTCHSQSRQSVSIIPQPVSVVEKPGNFIIRSSTKIVAASQSNKLQNSMKLLQQMMLPTEVGERKVLYSAKPIGDAIFIQLLNDSSNKEAYSLLVSPQNIVISAGNESGIFNALQTLRQLMPPGSENVTKKQPQIIVPAVVINDTPRFAWRGINLDVARHFLPKNFLEKFIETIALYKFNKLQLHLTDDQGWRIEIKKYPQLAQQGGFRDTAFYLEDEVKKVGGPYMAQDTLLYMETGGKKVYGGYYTQADMKEIIVFAKQHNVDILPEIDMPSHTGIATTLFPQLVCDAGGPICPCNEFAFEFAKNVYSEIIDLFPFEYIHLGVDEVDRGPWAKSATCKIFMQEKRIANADELQSYFTREMEKFFNSKGKKIIGWDEILEGGISKTATAMYWRTWIPDNLKNIFTYGNNVILAPTSHTYLDLQQNKNSLKWVYDYNPLNNADAKKNEALILGIQANLWSEVIPTGERVEYMTFPRALALANIAWTGGTEKNWNLFQQHVAAQYKRLDALNVHYKMPELDGFLENNLFVKRGTLTIQNLMPGTEVRYTTDSTIPTKTAMLYTKPVIVTKPIGFTIAHFRPNGEPGEIYKASFTEAPKYALPMLVPKALKGLERRYFEGNFNSCNSIDKNAANTTNITPGFELPVKMKAPFALQYSGYIYITQTGVYSFSTTSDDGSILKIDEEEIVNNDGVHKTLYRTGQMALEKGYHKIDLSFIEIQGDITLLVNYAPLGGMMQPIAPANLFH